MVNEALKITGQVVGIILMLVIILTIIGLATGIINTTNIKNFFDFENGFDFDAPPIEYLPPEETSCLAYDIASKFRETYGTDTIESFETACETLGGIWREDSKEIGCYWNPALGSIDCNTDTTESFEDYCEEGLLARWICDNTIAYAGCLCKRNVPENWIVPEEEPTYTCGWEGNICDGSCPSTHPICEEIEWVSGDTTCACLDDMFLPHPDWKPGNQYYNPYVPGEPEPEEYIEGQIGTIFVTDLLWNGASGGLDGIDEKCQIHATSPLYAGLSGTWIAIAGDTSANARTRVTIDVPFYRVDGVIIANSHADLFDGSIQNPININEYGELETGTSWTGSDSAGYYVSDNCHDWNWVSADGYYGDISSTGYSWLHDNKEDCSAGKHFYCARVS